MSRRETRGGDAPLLAWGESLRRKKAQAVRRNRRLAWGGCGIAMLGLTIAFPPIPRLVWNASASAPIGFYLLSPQADIRRGNMVVARLPEPWRSLAARRHYLPANVPLVKRVAGVPGDRVCASKLVISINGRTVGTRRAMDGHGRPMPLWTGCTRLGAHHYFLLMDHPASFDGRYSGPTDKAGIVGRAGPLWLR